MSHKNLHRIRVVIVHSLIAVCIASFSVLAESAALPRFRVKQEKAREHFTKAIGFYNRGQYVAAREFFYKALDTQPYFHLARRYLGDSYYYSGDWNNALEQWELLDEISEKAYPTVGQRRELLEFRLNRYRRHTDFSFLREIKSGTFRKKAVEYPADVRLDKHGRMNAVMFGSGNLLQTDASGNLKFETSGPVYNSMQGPVALDTGPDGRIFVADFSGDKVYIFTENGAYESSFGETGSADGQLRGPAGIAVSKNFLFVSDSANRRIQKFDREGNHLISFNAEGKLQEPAGMSLHKDGERLLVADPQRPGIFHFDTDGNLLGEISFSEMEKPRGVRFYRGGFVVSDEKQGILFYDETSGTVTRLNEMRDNEDEPVVLNRVFSADVSDRTDLICIADYGGHRIIQAVEENLKTAGLDIKIEKIELTNYPTVAVFATIKDRPGRVLEELTRSEIVIEENDIQVSSLRTDNMDTFQNRTNLVIVKENSDYLRDENLDSLLPSLLRSFVEPFRITDQIRLLRAGSTERIVYEGLERRELLERISTGDRSPEPNLGRGLYDAVTSLLPELGSRSVLFITSGKFTETGFEQYSLQRIVQYAAAHNISIHILSFEALDTEEEREASISRWKEVAADTGGSYLRIYDEAGVSALYNRIRSKKDIRYILTYDSEMTEGLSGRYVDVKLRVRYRNTAGLADGGYFVP